MPTSRLGLHLLAAALFAAPAAVAAQSASGHVYQLNEFKANAGMEAAYSQSYHEFLRPIWSEIVRNGDMVSFVDLWKQAGDLTTGTHMILLEFESWDDYASFGGSADRASRSVTGRPWADISAQEFGPLRELLRAEVYAAPPGGM